MRILKPKIDNQKDPNIEYIVQSHVYVKVTDYGLVSILKEVLLAPGNTLWMWIVMKENLPIDIFHSDKIHSFNEAVNRSVNDLYCTLYEFSSYKEILESWEDIKYIDDIGIIYKQEEMVE